MLAVLLGDRTLKRRNHDSGIPLLNPKFWNAPGACLSSQSATYQLGMDEVDAVARYDVAGTGAANVDRILASATT